MKASPLQLHIPGFSTTEPHPRVVARRCGNGINQVDSQDRAFHEWYRFVLSFPPHLVRTYLDDFGLTEGDAILDPFCGTGTTLVEAKRRGLHAVGIEGNPIAHFASSVKTDWAINPEGLERTGQQVAEDALNKLREQGIDDVLPLRGRTDGIQMRTLSREASRLLIKGSISPLPLHKTLVLLDCLRERARCAGYRHAVLALAKALVCSIGNLRFGPEVGVGKQKDDHPVVAAWLSEVQRMAEDLRLVRGAPHPSSHVHPGDAREVSRLVAPRSISAVITSPPYPNEKDYTRTTRLESVILGFIKDGAELRALKKSLVRSNTRGVYRSDGDHEWVAQCEMVQRLAKAIERRRVQLGKTSGFEKLYGTVTRLYFGGMARHLADLRAVLKPGARLAYVVGDQASYLRVMIRTGKLIAEIAQSLGYELIRIDLFRTRFATATREELREEVVVLRWPGSKG